MKLTVPLLCLLCTFFTLSTESQDSQKTNVIIFADGFFGHAWGRGGGFSGGASLNYQFKKNLAIARIAGTTRYKMNFYWFFPIIQQVSNLSEFSLLYGRRFTQNSMGYSFATGISHNTFEKVVEENRQRFVQRSIYMGLPFEVNIKWFKSQKRRYRIYGLIPVGKPTGFGRSFGFKLYGNLSQKSYAGFGLTLGMGYHKKYEKYGW